MNNPRSVTIPRAIMMRGKLARSIVAAILVVAASVSWLPAKAGKLEEYLDTELLGCRADLKTDVTWVRYRQTLDEAEQLFWEPPVGTWVTENGLVHHAEAKKTPNVHEAKFALLAGDRVEVRAIEAGRGSTRMTLALVKDPAIRAKLELKFLHGLRKDLSDIDRFWRLLSVVMVPLADPDNPGRCGGPQPTEAVETDSDSDDKDEESDPRLSW